MSCKSCVEICVLTSNECLCDYTDFSGNMTLQNLKPQVIYANTMIYKCIGEDCFNKICGTEEETDLEMKESVMSHPFFKLYYNQLIFYRWLCTKATAKYTKQGAVKVSTGSLDSDTEFEMLSESDIKEKKYTLKCELEELKEDFKKWFFDKFPYCNEKNSEEKTNCKQSNSCGCKNNCRCNKETKTYLPDCARI